MSNIMEKFQTKLAKAGDKVSNIVWLQIIQSAFVMLLPIIMVGSFSALFAGVDFGGYQDFITTTGIKDAFTILTQFTTNFLGVYLCFCVGYQFGQRHGLKKSSTSLALACVMVFFIVTPLSADGSIPVDWLGSNGMFTGFIVSFLTGGIFVLCKKYHWEIKLPDQVPPMIARQFSAVIPFILAGIIGLLIRAGFAITPLLSLQDAVYSVMRFPLSFVSTNIFGQLLMWMFAYLMWFVGINGPIVVLPILFSLFLPLQMENLAAFQAGSELPNILVGQGIICGHGSLPFIIAMFIWGKSKANRSISKVAILPSCFGIDEPAYFGYPMIMNPTLAIPWIIINPIIENVGTYLLQLVDLLPYATGAQAGNYNLPFITNFVSYGWRGVIWGFVFLALEIAVVYPFIKAYDKKVCEREAIEGSQEQAVSAE